MTVLIINLDIFESMKRDLLDFWKYLIESYKPEYGVGRFCDVVTSSSIVVLPELSEFNKFSHLCSDLFYFRSASSILADELRELGIRLTIDDIKDPISSKAEELRETIKELEDERASVESMIYDIENEIIKRRDKIWKRIDKIIFNSYIALVSSMSNSPELVNHFIRAYKDSEYGTAFHKSMSDKDYDDLLYYTKHLDSTINSWIYDIVRTAGVEVLEMLGIER